MAKFTIILADWILSKKKFNLVTDANKKFSQLSNIMPKKQKMPEAAVAPISKGTPKKGAITVFLKTFSLRNLILIYFLWSLLLVFFYLYGNIKFSLILFSYVILFICVGLSFYYILAREPSKAGTILGGAGIFVFTLLTFFSSSSIFMFGGTDATHDFPIVQLDNTKYVINIDLNVKNHGKNIGMITIITEYTPKDKILCNPDNCKDDSFPQEPQQVHIARTKLIIDRNTTKFSFKQTQTQQDLLFPIITSTQSDIRNYSCEANFKDLMVHCN